MEQGCESMSAALGKFGKDADFLRILQTLLPTKRQQVKKSALNLLVSCDDNA